MKTPAEIYKVLTVTYDRAFHADQCDAFVASLSDFDPVVIESAVLQWERNVSPDFDGRALGSKMPKPADLRSICMQIQAASSARLRGEFVSCGQCSDGWSYGLDAKGNDAVHRCGCFIDWAAQQRSSSREPMLQVRSRPRCTDFKSAAAAMHA